MTSFVNVLLLVINIISFLIVIVITIFFGIYEWLMGPAETEKMLKRLHISLSYNQVSLIYFASVLLTIVLFFVREKLAGRL